MMNPRKRTKFLIWVILSGPVISACNLVTGALAPTPSPVAIPVQPSPSEMVTDVVVELSPEPTAQSMFEPTPEFATEPTEALVATEPAEPAVLNIIELAIVNGYKDNFDTW